MPTGPKVAQLNSQTLQAVFPDVYRRFFAQCGLVVSAPRSIWWTGEYAELFGGPTITQKIPLRVYVGLERSKRNSIDVGQYQIYSPSQERFTNQRASPFLERTVVRCLKPIVRQLIGGEKFDGFRIHLLSELPFGHGLAGIGSLVAALIVSIYCFYRRLEPADVEQWKIKLTKDLLSPGSTFNNIHRQAWKLETMIDSPRSSGSRSFSALLHGAAPTIYFTERRSGNTGYHPDTRVPCKIESQYEVIDTIERWGFRLNELFGGPTPETSVIDVGLLFTGEEKITANVIRAFDEMETRLNEMGSRLYEPIKNALAQTDSRPKPFFLELCDQTSRGDLWSQYIDALAIMALETLEGIHQVTQSGGSKTTVAALAQKLRAYQDAFHLLNVSSPRLDSIRDVFSELADQQEIEPFGVKFTGSGGGGDLLFISSCGSLGERIDEIIKELRQRCGDSIYLDYVSWRDGLSDEGVRVEQALEGSVYSQFISRGSVVTRWWGPQYQDAVRVLSYEQYDAERSGIDLILDKPEQEVVIRGQVLHSDEIHSAKTTIDILRVLLKHYNQPVPAAELGGSSYVNRNEIQSKIITPLLKAYRRRAKARLPLVLQGGLQRNFTLKFSADQATVCVVEQRL